MAGAITNLKKFWHWLWNSESIWSYIIFLVLLFIIVKFIFLPGLGLVFGTSLPLAIVESSSMDHNSLNECNIVNGQKLCTPNYFICGQTSQEKKSYNSEDYWNTCGKWYEKNTNITKEQFSNFKLSDGFRKGDIVIIFGRINYQVGDVLVFNAGTGNPIIHRIISTNPLETKGDHNSEQLKVGNNAYTVDETNIQSSQIIGVAVAKIPYLGWIKLGVVEHPLSSGIIILVIILIFVFYSLKEKKDY